MSHPPLIQSFFYNNPDYYPPIINSATILHKAGYVQTIFCRDNLAYQGQPYPATTILHRIPSNTRNSLLEYLSFIWQALRHSTQKSIIYIGHDMHGFLVARILSFLKQRPVIYHCHDFADSTQKLGLGGHLVRKFERLFARTADVVIVPDSGRAKVVASELRLPRLPLVVANAPLKVPPADDTLSQVLNKLGYCFEKVVLRQAQIGTSHGLEVTLRSIPLWASKQWGFVLLGSGDANYIQHLRNMAHELGVHQQFVILPRVSYDSVLKYTVGADLGHAIYEPRDINHLHFTTASNKLMEYMAAGLPILMSATEGNTNLLKRHAVGMAVDITSSEAIANAINTVFQNPSLAQSMKAASQQAFEMEFQYEKQYAPVLEAITRLTKRSELSHAKA